MNRKQANQSIGRAVKWTGMDAKVNRAILERIGAHCIATVTYNYGYLPERYTTYKPLRDLSIAW